MDKFPDPNKKPDELREELGRKISELITYEINRAGRQHIQAEINKFIDDYSLGVDLHLNIEIKMIIEPMSGEDFVWPDLPPPIVSIDDEE